jgi:hypothetical protein
MPRLLGRAGPGGARLGEAETAPRVGIGPHPPTVAGRLAGVSPEYPLPMGEGLSARERSERLREGVRVGWSGAEPRQAGAAAGVVRTGNR